MTRRDKRTSIGMGLVIAGIMLYVGAGIASAIEYNMAETIEGALTGPPPIWIQALGWGAVALVVAGVAVAAVGLSNSRTQRTLRLNPDK